MWPKQRSAWIATSRQRCEALTEVQCDRGQPSCTRCKRKRTVCSGSLKTGHYIFRDERDIAKRNSRRARGEQIPPTRTGSPRAQTDDSGRDEKPSHEHQKWVESRALQVVSQPLKRDLDSRAVDRFFLDWILFPGEDKTAPGHLQTLPGLYHATKQGSLLWHAVRAVAFADVGHHRGQKDAEGQTFSVKARNSYGCALHRMRNIVVDEQELVGDSSFAALMLIDCFEVSILGLLHHAS